MNRPRAAAAWPRGRDFRPRGLLANRHVQTIMSSSRVRRRAQRDLRRSLAADAQPVLLEVAGGVRLTGVFTPQRMRGASRGLAVVFHGWEGSHDSNYVVQIASRLRADGWDVFRLNFRDHGDSHHLNTELFHSCMLDEVLAATIEIERGWHHAGTPIVLAGFSLGGNFALRVALAASEAGLALNRVVAVCPVIDPGAGLFALEQGPWVYHWYFMRKWRASLARKQRLFPDEHFYGPGDSRLGLRELTRVLIERRTDYGTLDNYLAGYSLAGARMAGMQVPTTILMARDDPVIPVADFAQLTLSPAIELDIAAHGGHCGFLMDWRFRSFTDAYIAARFNALDA
jgi:predicted alpha/beta-fold hydrolase